MSKKISFPITIIIIIVCAVLVGGIVAWQNLEMPKGEEEISEGEAPEEVPKDETADWKIYRNDEYGFEIKYPPDWFLLKEPDMFDHCKAIDKNCLQAITIQNIEESLIGMGDPEDSRDIKWFTIFIFETDASSIEKWIDQSDYSDIYKQEMLNSIVLMEIGKTEKRVWRDDLPDMIDMKFVHKRKHFSIRYTSYDVSKDQDIVRDVLSTFRFLE